MNGNRQLINLAGILIVVAVLVIGVVVVAMPMVGQAQDTDSRTRTVAQSNAVYDIQVAQLTAADARIAEIDASLAELRTAIAATPQLDDVFEIVTAAAAATTATIKSIRVADPSAWSPRARVVDATGSGLPVAAAAEASVPTTETPADATESGEGESTDPAPTAPTEPTAEPASSPRLQVVVTIEVALPDALAATTFLDALGTGPRLLAPITSTYLDGVLTVEALALIRTEDAS